MNDFSLSPAHTEMICNLFSQYKGIKKVSVFGSRSLGKEKLNSDVDFVFWGDIKDTEKRRLNNLLEDLPIPFQFDFIAYDEIEHKELKDHINRCAKPFYIKKET